MKSSRASRLLAYLLFGAAVAHVDPAAAEKEVTLKADNLSVDVPTDSYRASGNVRMSQDGISLLADSVIYRRLTGDAVAEGGIFLEKGEDTLKGNRLSLNMLSQQGELLNGELFIKKSNFRVRADRIVKSGPEEYRMERGSFTTCDGEHPSWRFEARKVKVTLDQFATARDAVFYAGDVPVLYTPYLVFPANTERQSGLLIPKLGHSSKKGMFLDQPYYWAINPSQEAIFNLDIESSRGVGVGGEYRYLRPHGSEGRLQVFDIYDTHRSRMRGELEQKHLEFLSPELTLASNIHLISDRDYYSDYGEFSGEYNRQLLESTVSFDRRWERHAFAGEVRYTQDLQAANNDATLQRLPALRFWAEGTRLGPGFLSMDSGFTNFQREEGVTGQRLELHPRYTIYAKPAAIMDLSLYGGYRQRMYAAQESTGENGYRQVGQADAGATLSLPLARVYDGRFRHLLVPSLEYGYVQRKNDADVPFFDYDDRVLGGNVVTASIAGTLTEKYPRDGGIDEYRDLLYLKLSQGYQISGERRDLLTLVDEGHRLTDLMLEAAANPAKDFSLLLDGRYNTQDGVLSTANVGFEMKGEERNKALVRYRHSRDEVDYVEGRVTFPLSRRFTADLLGRYSIDKGGFLESRYAVEYKFKCWSVVVAYVDRVGTRDVPSNQEVTVNFALSGLGSLGAMRAY